VSTEEFVLRRGFGQVQGEEGADVRVSVVVRVLGVETVRVIS